MSVEEIASERRIRALSFGGGAFDTVMQLGVTQALLVSDARPPDYVVGISAGAINAAALAEVLQSGQELEKQSGQGEEQNLRDAELHRLAARVRRLREFIDGYVRIPREIVASTFPDAFEVNAQSALKPVALPIHFDSERRTREDANRSRAGLILLLNHLLRIRLDISAMTTLIRRVLSIRQSSELSLPKRPAATRLWSYAGIWTAAGRHAFALSQIVFTVLIAAERGRRERTQKTAGEMILALRSLRATKNGALYASSLTVFLFIWLLPVLVVTGPPPKGLDAVWTPLARTAGNASALVDRAGEAVSAAAAKTGQTIRPLLVEWLADTLATFISGASFTVWETARILAQFAEDHVASIQLAFLAFLIALWLEMRFDLQVRWVAIPYLALLIVGVWQADRPDVACLPLAITVLLAVGLYLASRNGTAFITRLLEHYEIGDGILSASVLERELVKLFDRYYYGKHDVDTMNDKALDRGDQVNDGATRWRKRLRDYKRLNPPIHVGPVAANLADGTLCIISDDTTVVDALMHATAVSPLFPAHSDVPPEPPLSLRQRLQEWIAGNGEAKRKQTFYIDGLNVSNEPIQPLLDHLRDDYTALSKKRGENTIDEAEREHLRYLDNAVTVDLYSVSDLPVDQAELIAHGGYSTLVQVGLRAMELKDLRDATMERRLTRLYTRILPEGKDAKAFHLGPDGRYYIHAGVFPIELERPARINRRVTYGTTTDELRTVLHTAVADGCRATLEALMPQAILDHARYNAWLDRNLLGQKGSRIRAREDFHRNLAASLRTARMSADDTVVLKGMPAIDRPEGSDMTLEDVELTRDHFDELVEIIAPRCIDVIRRQKGKLVPGADEQFGPGIPEVCRQCRLFRPDPTPAVSLNETESSAAAPEAPPLAFDDRGRLQAREERRDWPRWPREGEATVPATCGRPSIRPMTVRAYDWPEQWPAADAKQRPTVSFLFGGGVFRGVFHMGVMNALNESGLQPDIVAGSSVGSIISAMIASVFMKPKGDRERGLRIRALAATFLAIDRFVLTDRLADFVRRLTLRAAEARFSPRDLDLLLRRYDIDFPGRFNQRMRKVAAGVERLFYLSPFELQTLVKAARMQETAKLLSELAGDVQEFLERGGVGEEILGSEPLSLLISRHVEDLLRAGEADAGPAAAEREMRFGSFGRGEAPIYFIATATNLVRGTLEILNAPFRDSRPVSLAYGLLASSAFPAVFRPRHSWEIFLGSRGEDETYIDGGVIDNLPLDAVARILDEAAKPRFGKINPRPAAPHLLFTASLEESRDLLSTPVETERRNFLRVQRRAKSFKLNRKIDSYRTVQERLNGLYTRYARDEWTPVSLAVVTVKPKWLCKTFGFHPMLGFRRRRQAQSIAHGCASTLAHLADVVARHPNYAAEWRMNDLEFDESAVERKPQSDPTKDTPTELLPKKSREKSKTGQCWFRSGDHPCPFSKQYRKNVLGIDEDSRASEADELHQIYKLCGETQTHESAK